MKIVILNGAKVNYDGIIDYSVLAEKEDQLVIFDKIMATGRFRKGRRSSSARSSRSAARISWGFRIP